MWNIDIYVYHIIELINHKNIIEKKLSVVDMDKNYYYETFRYINY